MEKQDLEVFDDVDFNNEAPRKRPAFITVLAILSWVYVAIGVFSALANSLSSEEAQIEKIDEAIAIYDSMDDMPFLDDSVAVLEASRDNLRVTNLGNLIFLLIEGIAVFMMFNLKRNGFWLYTIAQIGLVSLMIMVMPWPNLIPTLTVCVTLFLVILFEILYAVNLKHMKA
ncbi:MAG: hypothetical protein P8L20_03750 [Flavobacteriales bacterium]|nr:hypothetical protein [Flavobacteriales bacterium]